MQHVNNHENFTEDQLYKIVDEHPYYQLAHFWLLNKTSGSGTSSNKKQASKTALYFKNHSWLSYQLYIQNKITNEDHVHVETNNLSNTDNTFIKSIFIEPEQNTIAFEPLHTVDYFASQGIKVNEEPISNDKLGTQLKSFTEWLKTMKKIRVQDVSNGDENTDKKIQSLAESSNAKAEIVTESMAEVLIKQGKTDKAIEVYQKLSLNNPSKSAYFAAKIKSLKTYLIC